MGALAVAAYDYEMCSISELMTLIIDSYMASPESQGWNKDEPSFPDAHELVSNLQAAFQNELVQLEQDRATWFRNAMELDLRASGL